jgi:hypothetical protein
MGKQKTRHSPAGFKVNCPDFDPSPLCYGCRNYDPSYYKCVVTCKPCLRENTCNKDVHTEKKLTLIIKPMTIEL